ncbi:MAG: NYN domain-containing protein [Pseudomonas asiatica]
MDRLGVFVDAGYLFASGSLSITGDEVSRNHLSLNEQAVVAQLIQTAAELSGGVPLLRIYWYDAIGRNGPNLEQTRLANSNNVKLRAGTLNGSGQQKGVDSMIVIDMIELARNHAISDAVLLSGDEDVRVGVQFAQNYGVRVHLIGVANQVGKKNQSSSLIQESDTHVQWSPEIVSSFLTVRTPKAKPASQPAAVEVPAPPAVNDETVTPDQAIAIIEASVRGYVGDLVQNDVVVLKEHLKGRSSIPREFDAKLLGISREAIKRQLELTERKLARQLFVDLLANR